MVKSRNAKGSGVLSIPVGILHFLPDQEFEVVDKVADKARDGLRRRRRAPKHADAIVLHTQGTSQSVKVLLEQPSPELVPPESVPPAQLQVAPVKTGTWPPKH